MIDINLLPPKNVLSQQEKNLRARLTQIVAGISVVVILVSALIIGTRLILAAQLNSQTAKKEELLAQFNSQSQTAQDLRTLKNKIAGIKIILSSRTNFASMSGRIKDVLAEVPPKGFNLDSDGNINLSASANSVDSLGGFIDRISSNQNNPFTKTSLTGLIRDPGGSYTFGVISQYSFAKQK